MCWIIGWVWKFGKGKLPRSVEALTDAAEPSRSYHAVTPVAVGSSTDWGSRGEGTGDKGLEPILTETVGYSKHMGA